MVMVYGEVQILCCEEYMLGEGVSSSCYVTGVVGSLLVCNDKAGILVC